MSNFKVPYVDIPTEIRPQKHMILDAVSKVLESGSIYKDLRLRNLKKDLQKFVKQSLLPELPVEPVHFIFFLEN